MSLASLFNLGDIYLQEYSYDQIEKFADLYDKVVNEVVKVIKHSVKTFKDLTSTYQNTAFSDIIDTITQSVKQMPGKVVDLRRIGKRIFKAIGKFVELPPVVTQVKGLITKVTTLFNDIKTDVMELYDVSSLCTFILMLIIIIITN